MKSPFEIRKLPPKAKNPWFEFINRTCKTRLGREASGHTFFGVFLKDVLVAFGGVRCNRGNWYLGLTYVRERYRGKGLQRKLIEERLKYLKLKTKTVRVGVKPGNMYSLNNIIWSGFRFEKAKEGYYVYKIEL